MIDETGAVREIKGLSVNARRYLQHTRRNALQSVAASVEAGTADEAEASIKGFDHELRRIGL